jgi:hypothetical protein
MARQNVGNPKFYIDLPSYWRAMGNISNVTHNGVSGNNAEKLIGLNPSDFFDEQVVVDYDSYWQFKIDLELDFYTSANHKYFLGFLGHDFETSKLYTPQINLYQDDGAELDFEFTNGTWDEICNFSGFRTLFEYNGWSLCQIDDLGGYTFDSFRVLLARETLDPLGDPMQDNNPVRNILGSITFGQVFQMPHSPDLKLTMTREFDGIQEQTTRGGSTLTQINYTRTPDWVGVEPWALTLNSTGGYEDDTFRETRTPNKGRKIWDLKFSYVSSDDLFSPNERNRGYNPTDSNTNELAGYDTIGDGSSTDFYVGEDGGGFIIKSFSDTSFMGSLMDKTMGGALPFIFQPDGNNNSPDQFAICKLDQSSFKFKQVAHNVWDISLKIREVW